MSDMRIGPTGHPITTKKQRRIVIPDKAREYIKNSCGEYGLNLIEQAVYLGEWVVLDVGTLT